MKSLFFLSDFLLFFVVTKSNRIFIDFIFSLSLILSNIDTIFNRDYRKAFRKILFKRWKTKKKNFVIVVVIVVCVLCSFIDSSIWINFSSVTWWRYTLLLLLLLRRKSMNFIKFEKITNFYCMAEFFFFFDCCQNTWKQLT